jgi:putative hemolysin
VNTAFESIRLIVASPAQYVTYIARDSDDVFAAQRLRFEVFNVELNEGLTESYATGRDEDPFDAVCDHLVVKHLPTSKVVGTYRLQTGLNAQAYLGYYSAQEFEFGSYEHIRNEIIELGRACVDRQHRNLVVLGLLWKGIAEYAVRHRARYLLGCSSLTSQDPSIGASAYTTLCRHHLAPVAYQTTPRPAFDCPLDQLAAETPNIPKLLRGYLAIGAKICGPPALDRQFKTIDFLTLRDLQALPAPVRARFFS